MDNVIAGLRKKIAPWYKNFRGWRTDRKIVVIESDDWGSIRLPSKGILKKLEKMGIKTDRDIYLRYDSLASETDLTELFNLLESIKNLSGNSPVITANTIMANPDFERIRSGRFSKYYLEPFTQTLQHYPEHNKSFEFWRKGIDSGVFYPQFHGREHLHVNRWLKGLRDRNSETSRIFDKNVFGVGIHASTEKRKSYMAAWDWDDKEDREFSLKSVVEGLKMFEEMFGYKSRSAIAPNYTWNIEIEQTMASAGVKYLQGGSVQRIPQFGMERNKVIRHYTGEENSFGQIYFVRNCQFEPSSDSDKDWVSECLKEIQIAFRCKKPAIIESHRVNFIGFIEPDNRRQNLRLFEQLLNKIVKRWPDVEFLNSEELGGVIQQK